MTRLVQTARVSLTALLVAGCASAAAPAAEAPHPEAPALRLTGIPAADPSAANVFFARPEGSRGPAIAYDMLSGKALFGFPAGMASADGRYYFAASAGHNGETALEAYQLNQGQSLATYALPGQWQLSGVSPTGSWLAVTRMATEEQKSAWAQTGIWETEIRILDAHTGETVHSLTLEGNFEVETVSADGKSLYLVQHLPAVNPDHYLIRLYDLSRESLVADPLRSKTSDEVMAGYAIEGLASQDGRWLLTLYLSTRRNVAFIHALNMVEKFPICLDLPSGSGDFEQLKAYALALSADGKTIYAANPALGVVAEVGLDDVTGYGLRRVVAFAEAAPASEAQGTRSLLAPDGSTLYFSSGRNVWAYDTASRAVRGPLAAGLPITGLGVSDDGGRLFVAQLDGSWMAFDVESAAGLR